MLTKKITKEELLIIAAAREIENGDVAALGIGLPVFAGAVAKKTHAPDAVLMLESGIVDFDPLVPPTNIADATCTRGYGYAIDLFSVFTTIAYAGYLDKAFLGVGQIDRYGNLNTTYMGAPPLAQRITGAGGATDFASYAKKTILTMRGRGFVDKLPYLTSPGYLGGGDERDRSGRYTPGSGPDLLLTQKAMFRFHPETKEMYLDAVFPGYTVEDIKADVPWELKVADTLSHFPVPTDEEIYYLRKFSPRSPFQNQVGQKLMIEHFQRRRDAR
ncbi:MAG: 3-oxoadipate CoA-transferase subunit B [Syntrophaceae bacterium PtaU1.Bin231]|nr:MAG: 3-oxoadipate CoA-transferase subunit B [Syntrophaceae bacterium PtaU1.Bin231]